jgi:hypothetical protein
MSSPDLHRALLLSPVYALACSASQGMVRAVVTYAHRCHALSPLVRTSGYFGFAPNFCEIQYIGREAPAVTVSLFGSPERYREAGLGAMLVPAQPGYARVRIRDPGQLSQLQSAMDLAWRLRARRPSK